MQQASLNIDTHSVFKHLQKKGFSEEQAEGVIEALQEVTLSGVATKQDIADLRQDMANQQSKALAFLMAHTIAIIGVIVAIQFIPVQ